MFQLEERAPEIETRGSSTSDDAVAIGESIARPEAFTLVFDRHYEMVTAFVRKRIGPDAAEEIVAETFTRAFDKRSRYDLSYPNARPWLLGIATNLLHNHWRTEKRRLNAYSRMPLDPAVGEPRTPPSPDLLKRLERLPRGQRDVLLLHALGDLTYEEIATSLGIRVGTVRSRLARARRRMGAGQGRRLTEALDADAKESSSA